MTKNAVSVANQYLWRKSCSTFFSQANELCDLSCPQSCRFLLLKERKEEEKIERSLTRCKYFCIFVQVKVWLISKEMYMNMLQ